jgi:FkbM family methyltransferase
MEKAEHPIEKMIISNRRRAEPYRAKSYAKKLIWRIISLRRREMTLKTRNGALTFNTRDRVLGKQLYCSGDYEWGTIVSVMETLQTHSLFKGGMMLDVGANIGMISIACLNHGFFERAMAFEPEAYNFSLLKRNVRQNGLESKINCFNCALSSQNGTMDLEISKNNYGDHRLRPVPSLSPGFFREEHRKTRPVKTMKLDDLMARNPGIQDSIGLAWVDIQGHEGHFLMGARNTLGKRFPVVCEFWPYAMQRAGTSRDRFVKLAEDLFAGFFHIAPDLISEWKDIKALDGLFDEYSRPREMGTVLFT